MLFFAAIVALSIPFIVATILYVMIKVLIGVIKNSDL